MPDRSQTSDPLSFIAGGGDMARRIRAHDWSQHPFGPPETWPQSLRSAVSICLHSAFPTAIYWGPELRLLYNDAWAPIPGPRHPAALGKPAKEVWADIWDIIWPQFRNLLENGEGFYAENQMLPMRRYGFEEETYWNYNFTAIRGEDGRIAGIFNSGFETTGTVLSERRLKLKLALNERLHEETNSETAVATATAMLGAHFNARHAGYLAPPNRNSGLSIVHDWAAEGPGFTAKTLKVATLGDTVKRRLAAGETLRIDDVETLRQATDDTAAEAFAAQGIRAALFVPLLHGGRLAAALYLFSEEARHWTDDEVVTLQEALESIWDITQILRNEERQELLMREVDHRAGEARGGIRLECRRLARPVRVVGGVAGADRAEQRDGLPAHRQRGDEVTHGCARRRVGPVKILQHEHGRARRRVRLQKVDDSSVNALGLIGGHGAGTGRHLLDPPPEGGGERVEQ